MRFILVCIKAIKFNGYYQEIYRQRREYLRTRLYQCV